MTNGTTITEPMDDAADIQLELEPEPIEQATAEAAETCCAMTMRMRPAKPGACRRTGGRQQAG